ncbi:glycine/D-amino acid oxidase-like deaminating enzyme [Bradyrhizobium sp. USDA 4350]
MRSSITSRTVTAGYSVEQRPQHVLADDDGCGDGQRAARHRPLAAGRDVGLLELAEDPPARRRVTLAGVAQLQRPRRAMKQFGADMMFEERDRPADRRRRAPQLPPRTGKAALVDRRDEDLHGVDAVHRSPRVRCSR